MKFNDAKYFGIKLSPHRIKNDKGQLIVTGCEFARTGKQKYHTSELGIKDRDEFIYLDRPVKEVSDSKTVASFEGAPVTLDHPKDDVKVGVNWDKLAKGFATNVKYIADSDTEGHLQADFIFTDANLIKMIENNEISELSAGYNCDVDEDTWVQSHIRGNHIAVVQQARAGHQARLLDKKYESASPKIKTVKIGDKEVKVVSTYTYELEDSKGNKVKCTDCYGETASGKKKFLCTIKDGANPKNVILCKVDNKWTKWGGTNKNKLEEDSRYDALVKKYGKENLKFVKNENLDEELKKLNDCGTKIVKDSKESDAKVLEQLEKMLPEFDKLDKKYASLVEMQKKYWNNWDGYRTALIKGDLSKDKYDKMQKQSIKANKEYLELVKKWNKLCMQTMRKGRPDWFPKGVATEIRASEEIVFPENHYRGEDAFKKFSYMLNEVNKVVKNYPKGTGNKNWTKAKAEDGMTIEEFEKIKDELNPIFEKRQAIDDKLRSLFSDPCFEVEGFMNGNDSDEGSIYVIDYNPYKDKACKKKIREDEDVYSIEDLDTEDFLELASDYIETKITPMLEKVEGFESLDVGITDWSGEEEYPIDFHIYCEGVTK